MQYSTYENSIRPADGPMSTFVLFVAFSAFSALVCRQAFAAPIRAYLPELWYVPDGIVGAAFATLFLVSLFRSNMLAIFWIWAIVAYSLMSLMSLHGLSVLFGMRQVLAFAIAVVTGLHFRQLNWGMRPLMLALCTVAIAGAIYDSMFDFPWSGLVFEGAFGTNDVSRAWWTDGETRRIAGLGIASTDTALLIVCTTLIVSTGLDKTSRLTAVLLIGPAVYAVWLAQQRATMVWFGFFWLVACLAPILIGPRVVPTVIAVLRTICISAAGLCIVIPFALYRVSIGRLTGADVYSLDDRTMNVWPWAIDRITEFPTILTGAGIGSVAEAVAFTNPALAIAPDNMFLFLYTTFGISSLILVGVLVTKVYGVEKHSPDMLPAISVLSILLFNGITANILNGMVGVCFLGLAIGMLWSDRSGAYKPIYTDFSYPMR